EGSPIAINNVDRYGFAFKCNRAMESLLGYSADELSRMHFNDFTHPDDRDIGPDMIHELRSGPDDIVKFDKRYVKKNGEIICAHLTVSAVRDEAGTVMYYIAIVEDITEWWNAQETIRRSEERYRSLVDNARDTIFTLSPMLSIFCACLNSSSTAIWAVTSLAIPSTPAIPYLHCLQMPSCFP
ncbi:MAG: PAS domain S-box protein, partial [Bacteroidetes bacterium]|nr:PAS domain S-box protein [Bacteroidota bacterium]